MYHFAKENPDIKIAVVAFQYPYKRRKYRWNGITVYPCGGRGKRRFYRLFTWLLAVLQILRFHLRHKITVIHSFWLAECAFIGYILSKTLLVKHIASIMGQDVAINNLYLKYLDFSQIIVTAPSQNAADIYSNSSQYTVNKIIPIGLDVDNFNGKSKNQARKIDILGVGSLTSLKNYELFITIIRELSKSFPKINAVIIGYGKEYYPLEQMIIEYGLENNIELFGKLSRPETIDYMYQSKIFLHTSTYESQGYVFLEALYCGLTVVCFDVGLVEQSDKMIVCANQEEMLENLEILLKSKLNYQHTLMKSIDETVKEFQKLY